VPAAAQAAPRPAAAAPGRGDLALVNARVLTVEPSRPRAEAVLVRAGRLALVGTSAEVKAKAGDARLFDAGGRTVVPGFIDAHTHMEVAVSHQEVDATILGGDVVFQR
jgi:predicted amidohydrolase YtcJ